MKTIITLLIIFSGFTFIMAQQDTSVIKDNKVQNRIQVQERNKIGKSIGPKDNPEDNRKFKSRKKDVFIDKDGDGICDTRQSGMSFNKLRKRYGKQGADGGHGRNNGNSNGNSRGGGK